MARDGRALGGVEQQLNEMLSGQAGYSVLRRDARGRAQPTISLPVVSPVDGADVYLTIDFDLQEIADGALREAIEGTGASGGDLLISDPRTGEVLAAVSRRGGRARSLTAITEPYEPGSTLKPFLAAAILQEGRATLDDTVSGENGRWHDGRRTVTDSHAAEWLSLARRDPRLEQHRNHQVQRTAHPGRAVPVPARLRLRHADGDRVPGRIHRPPAEPGVLVGVQPGESGDGLRALRHPAADDRRLRRTRERRGADGAVPGPRGARTGWGGAPHAGGTARSVA